MNARRIGHIGAWVFSLGVIGWLMAKIGVLDVLLTLAINFAILFPVLAITFRVMKAEDYERAAAGLNSAARTVKLKAGNWKFSEAMKGKGPAASKDVVDAE